jgi:Major capsid protein N-terminus/Large eukaryotic DNA virus major capsid protein
MAGGLLNLISVGQQNVILNGDPTKTFFKSSYSKYTNFGLQKFRVDFEGSKTLRLSEPSTFQFKIPRYADLLMDTYVSVSLPNIWSPIFPPVQQNFYSAQFYQGRWAPYEFRWIENLGAQMISEVSITCGNTCIQKYTGAYLLASVQRDFNTSKKELFDKMTGNVPELNNPANAGSRVNMYPNAYHNTTVGGPEPSIRGTTLYIPINSWFMLKSQMAFPLASLQYNELYINITFRPISELFQIRDVLDDINQYPYVAPNFNLYYMQFYRFLQPPPDVTLGIDSYTDLRVLWNADIHLNCTYCFLSDQEQRVFALQEQKYLFKQVHQYNFLNVTGSNRVQLDSLGLVANYLFFFQRSDANLRNEWSNYTNWPYNFLPNDIVPARSDGTYSIERYHNTNQPIEVLIGPGVNPNGLLTGYMITNTFSFENEKNILVSLAILLDGSYRENTQPAGVFNYIEKYIRTTGSAPDGLYCYNFCLHSSNADLQPSGTINMSRFNVIEFEIVTIIPPLDPLAQSLNICDPNTGGVIGVNKPTWRIFDYNYNLYIFEERYNMLTFISGNCGLTYAT